MPEVLPLKRAGTSRVKHEIGSVKHSALFEPMDVLVAALDRSNPLRFEQQILVTRTAFGDEGEALGRLT